MVKTMARCNLSQQAWQAVIDGDVEGALEIAKNVIETGMNPIEIIDQGFIEGMIAVADSFSKEEIPLSSVLMAAEAMNSALESMRPYISAVNSDSAVIEAKGIFLSKRILVAMQPLFSALKLMESTRYTWQPLLWDLERRVKNTFQRRN
jgi:cobalamin-dependent methionine synthase I